MGGGWIGKRGERSSRATDSQRFKASASRTFLIYLSILLRNHMCELHCYATPAAAAAADDDNDDDNNKDDDNDDNNNTL
jgi:hypothetical protein